MLKLPIIDSLLDNTNARVFVLGHCNSKCNKYGDRTWCKDVLANDLWTPIEDLEKRCLKDKECGVTAIILWGGTNNKGVTPEMLIEAITRLSKIMPVGLASSLPDRAYIHKVLMDRQLVNWLLTESCKVDARKTYELREGVYYAN